MKVGVKVFRPDGDEALVWLGEMPFMPRIGENIEIKNPEGEKYYEVMSAFWSLESGWSSEKDYDSDGVIGRCVVYVEEECS